MKAGLNLFSVRQLAQTERDFANLAGKLREMGYSYLQVSGIPLEPQAIARVSEESGLPVHLMHSSLNKILNDTDSLMTESEIYGCHYIGLGFLTPDIIADEAKCKDIISRLNDVGGKMRERGFTLFLHNHCSEFFRYENETAFEYIIKNAPELHFILDTYWVQYGGEDVVRILDKIAGRVECVHLKDYRLEPVKENLSAQFIPRFAPVGSGTLDFSAIVKAATAAGTKYFFVEQDDAGEYPDPLGQVKKSIDYIKTNL